MSDQDTAANLTLPSDLESYLPPNLWHRVTHGIPSRGVLLNLLDRLRSLLYLLSTYLPSHLAQEKMRRPTPGLVRGQMLNGSLLFADVSGFTALSERLAVLGQEGAERLTELMNRYFERMLKILAWSGGILLKFAGDALLVYFPEQEDGEQARWAARAGQRAMGAIADFGAIETPLGTVGLRMKIGVGTGSFLAGSVGNAKRMEYVILGGAVVQTMAAEGVAEAGQVIVDEATASHLDPTCCLEQATGFYNWSASVTREAAQELGDYEIKAERRRARGAIPWSASPRAIAVQIELALRQIQALTPYLAADLAECVIVRARQREVEAEFRPTTVLFLNFTGLESLLALWGDAGVRRVTSLLNDYFQAVHRVIIHHGGIVSRIDPYSRGSKMLVLFGAPVAHEDDPQRAVSAALALGDELARLNDRWRRKLARYLPSTPPEVPGQVVDGPLIQQRIGITQGSTLAGLVGSPTRREYTVMGDDVNLAARLMAAAQPGQILISQRVYDAVVNHFAAIALPAIRVKGKSQPIPVYQPTAPRDDPLARRSRDRRALVDRKSELEQGRAAIRQALKGQGTILTIQGPAGAGKSHLADTLVTYAQARGVRALFSECRSYTADAPYAPWIALLQSLAGMAITDSPSTRREKLLRTLTDLGLAADQYADPLANLLDLQSFQSPGTSRQSVDPHTDGQPVRPQQKSALFVRLEQKVTPPGETRKEERLDLWQLVQKRPFEQVQGRQQVQPGQMWQNLQARVTAREQEWLFGAVGDLLARLSVENPLLLFFENAHWMDVSSRALLDHLNGELHKLPILALVLQRKEGGEEEITDGGKGITLTLGPLDLEDTTALASHLLGKATVSFDVVRAIQEQSGGNPLFVKEIARWMQRTGQDTLDSLRAGAQTAAASAAASAAQASVLLQELVLSHLDSLSHGQRDTIRAASVIGNEFRRGAVRALLTSTPDDALDTCLHGLERARLILLTEAGMDNGYTFRHTMIREVIYSSQSFARRRELHASMAAYLEACHADVGSEGLAQQAELLAHHYELAEQHLLAARYLLVSGDKARQRYAYPQAIDYYERALVALERLPPEEMSAEALTLRAQTHEGRGDASVLTGDFEAAAVAYEAVHEYLTDETQARLLVKLALVLPTLDGAAKAETLARRAWSESKGAQGLAAAATMAWLLWRAGNPEADAWIERGKGMAAQGMDPWTVGIAALLTDLSGDWGSAQRAYLAVDQPVGAALATCRQGDRHLHQGDLAEALGLYNQAAAIWEKENDAYGLALARHHQAEVWWQKGEPAAARAALQEAASLLETVPSGYERDGQNAVQQAIAAVETLETGTWPPWQWQRYDDIFRISILFRS